MEAYLVGPIASLLASQLAYWLESSMLCRGATRSGMYVTMHEREVDAMSKEGYMGSLHEEDGKVVGVLPGWSTITRMPVSWSRCLLTKGKSGRPEHAHEEVGTRGSVCAHEEAKGLDVMKACKRGYDKGKFRVWGSLCVGVRDGRYARVLSEDELRVVREKGGWMKMTMNSRRFI
ncbi:unnamed protein product [Dovyalis caffra]|uniref:Uncharacterized protein n=1 Tax=Dovyalis caffra TaxID=77055 RepID=A0AAV1RNI9_9ROSI|nr:unnamed protein product [Dovyalis caffra]